MIVILYSGPTIAVGNLSDACVAEVQ